MIYFGHWMALLRVWEGSKQLRIFSVWWGLVLAFGWDALTSWPVVSYTPRAALIASSFEMGSQWFGAWIGLTAGSRSKPTGGPWKPRPWKSDVQFLEINPRVQVSSVGQTRIDVSGGGGAADTWWLSGSVVSGWGGSLVEHFLMKSARRVSASSVLLASVLSKAGWSVLMTWKVRSFVNLPLLAGRASWPMGLVGRLSYSSITVFLLVLGHAGKVAGWKCVSRGCRIYLERNFCSGFSKRSKTKWPLSEGGAVVVTSVLGVARFRGWISSHTVCLPWEGCRSALLVPPISCVPVWDPVG